MFIFEELSENDHEQVVFCHDKASGLKAIIAIHNTALGPALGGCRMWPYLTEEQALKDVLRLSRGMTYKAALAGLNWGGGKSVIMGDAKTMKSENLFRAFGRFVQSLAGRYITAEDVGTSVQDMEWVHKETDFVTGLEGASGGCGDPSPVTAFGVYQGILASLQWVFNEASLKGRTVCVQGVGHVGFHLLKYLSEQGAKIIAADIDKANVYRAKEQYPMVEFIAAESIYDVPCDIFSPCALGGVINNETIARLKCRIIAGGANNVLADEKKHSEDLAKYGIWYAPDFVINAGGLINVSHERGRYDSRQALKKTEGIYDGLMQIFKTAKKENITTLQAAKAVAEKRIKNVAQMKRFYLPTPLLNHGFSIL